MDICAGTQIGTSLSVMNFIQDQNNNLIMDNNQVSVLYS